jgi:pyrimidine-specific ribonucleoside hydrolase
MKAQRNMTTKTLFALFVPLIGALSMAVAHAQTTQPAKNAPSHRVWLDVDPANGIGEIDDGLAMIQAFNSPELRIAGVSVVYGNAPLNQAYPIGLNITHVFGPAQIEAHRGAAGSATLGEPTAASQAMAKALRRGPMTILALGPVTNVGTLLKQHPELTDRIEQIIVVAGRRSVEQQFISGPKQKEPFTDFNFEHDPAAIQIILNSNVPLVLAPWEVSSDVWLNRNDLSRLRQSGGTGLWIAATSQQWIDGWERRLNNQKGGNPFDTLAVGYLTHPELINGFFAKASIVSGPVDNVDDRNSKPYLVVERANNADTSTIYLHSTNPGFKQMLMKRLAGPKDLK